MIGHKPYTKPNAALRRIRSPGMRQTINASNPAASNPHAAEITPDLRKNPMRTSSTTMGSAATTADNAMECRGSTGWGQGIIDDKKPASESGMASSSLFQRQVVAPLRLRKPDQLRLDADAHSCLLIDRLADVFRETQHVICRCSTFIEQHQRLCRVNASSSDFETFESADIHQQGCRYIDLVCSGRAADGSL